MGEQKKLLVMNGTSGAGLWGVGFGECSMLVEDQVGYYCHGRGNDGRVARRQ